MWGSSGFRGFLGEKELKTPNVWSEPLRRSEPIFNWYCCTRKWALSNNEINFEKLMVVVVECKFVHANKFKSILVLLSKREIPFHPIS
jgi:hypothetical protein